MAIRLELCIYYDEEMFPHKGICSVCGEDMPQRKPKIADPQENIRWFSDQPLFGS
jgi:hypothetical protein